MEDNRHMTDADVLAYGRAILKAEAEGVLLAAESLGGDFVRAVRLVEARLARRAIFSIRRRHCTVISACCVATTS